MKILKYGMVALQRRGVVFVTLLLRNTRTYLVGLRPANLLSLHFRFYFLFPLIYLCILVAVIRRSVFNISHPGVFLLTHIISLLSVIHTIYSIMLQTTIQGLHVSTVYGHLQALFLK